MKCPRCSSTMFIDDGDFVCYSGHRFVCTAPVIDIPPELLGNSSHQQRRICDDCGRGVSSREHKAHMQGVAV